MELATKERASATSVMRDGAEECVITRSNLNRNLTWLQEKKVTFKI
jgi:hypothetical protein